MMKNNELQESATDKAKEHIETDEGKYQREAERDLWWEDYKKRPLVIREEAGSLAREIMSWIDRGADMKSAQSIISSAMGQVFAESGYVFKIKAEKLY